MIPSHRSLWLPLSLGLATVTLACASSEAHRAKYVAASTDMCAPSELSAELLRETSSVREWMVGCDFRYVRVHCSADGCQRAEPKPPCMGDMPCFVEDPETLRWELPASAMVVVHPQ